MREGGIASWSLGRGLALHALSALFASAVLLACGGDPGDVDSGAWGDTGVDAATPDGGAEAPGAPMPPSFAPCPPGTVEEPREGAPAECWPVGEPGCTGDEVRYLGETACSSVGSPCPAGDFPEDVEASAVYVLAGATGGDGTRRAPFATVAEGLAGAGLGRTVVVGRGTYVEEVELRRSVTLRGVCAEETVLTSTARDEIDPVVGVTGGTVTVRDISIRSAPRGGLAITGSGTTGRLEGVLVDGTTSYGVYVDRSATGTADGLVVRRVATSASGGLFGSGVVVDTEGRLTASRVVVEAAHTSGIQLLEASSLTADRVTIRDIEPNARGEFGRAVSVRGGSSVELDRLWVERVRELAVDAGESGTTVSVARAVVDDVMTSSAGIGGRPFAVFEGAAMTLRQVIASAFGDVGFFVSTGAVATAEDLVIRGARGNGAGEFGRMVEVQEGASFEGRRLRLEEGLDVAFAVADEGTRVVVEDLHIEGMAGQESDGVRGRGMNIQFGCSVEVRRAAILDTRNVGLLVDAASIVAEDLELRGVEPVPGSRRGRGINLQGGAIATLARVRVDDSYDLGLFVGGPGTEVTAADLSVHRVVSPPCPTGESCPVDPGGIGVGVYGEGRCTVSDIVVSEAALCGVHVAEGGELDLAGGRISDSTIGACVQVEGYDVGRLDSVRFEGNGTSLEATSLPVPQGSMSIER